MIPKVIHYCWFGGADFPEEVVRCIDSWKKFCPNYEIREWNESNFDLKICSYVEEAYQEKKWAFVSDYARFWILFNYGGLYFDTDVELIKPIDDIVARGAFMGCEAADYVEGEVDVLSKVAPGLGLATMPGHAFYKEILDFYSALHFKRDDGSINIATVVDYITDLLKLKGFDCRKNEIQRIEEINIYPIDYFCPMDFVTGEIILSENTRSIHHYMASWLNKGELRAHRIGQKVSRKFGKKNGDRLERILSSPYKLSDRVRRHGWLWVIKRLFQKFL